jgi:hypothetical protein
VAEYLAGLHLVREHGQDETAWKAVLERLDACEGGLEAIRGFVLALRDCCLCRPGEVPDFLADELAKRGQSRPGETQRSWNARTGRALHPRAHGIGP